MKISVNKHKLENMIETIVNCNNSYLLDDLYLLTYDITCAKNKQKCCDCPFRNKESILEVSHECESNAQALINISRKRLCGQASSETRKAWEEVKEQVSNIDPVLSSVMVKECIYRGFRPEFNNCGYCNTEQFKKDLEEYRSKG